MPRFGGTKAVRTAAAATVGLLLAGGVAACTYDEDAGPLPARAGQSQEPSPSPAINDASVLDTQVRNYAELERLLATAPGSALLDDAGPADGPGVGFTQAAAVPTAGPHTVTAACVGIPHTQISLSQNTDTGTEHVVFEVDCTGPQTQVVQLRQGYVSAQLSRPDPNGPWTGAVAGLKITAG